MGKSPGKWIKALLFPKKISRLNASKRTATGKKAYDGKKDLVEDAPTSFPLDLDTTLQTIDEARDASGLQKGTATSLDVIPLQHGSQDVYTEEPIESGFSIHDETVPKEKAVAKIQAAYRGYLARRAFRALKGIIRLQAVIRGHLVRRQAVATLHSMYGIIKLQAWARGRLVRQFPVLEVQTKPVQHNSLDKHIHSSGIPRAFLSEMVSSNAFYSKLIASTILSLPLRVRYDSLEPNSLWSWLIRWSSSRFWVPIRNPKKYTTSKPKRKQTTRSDEQGSKPKPTIRRAYGPNPETPPLSTCLQKKSSSSPSEVTQENSQNEIERVKRNLRKVSISKSECNFENIPQSAAEKLRESEIVRDSSVEDGYEGSGNEQENEMPPKLSEENQIIDYDVTDQSGKENQKTRRRRSLPIKQAYPVSASQVSPVLPSYMAATESAKAKARSQGSPRLSQDGADNGSARRHSLPAANGKTNSQLPRMQKLAHGVGKEKVMQAEWKR